MHVYLTQGSSSALESEYMKVLDNIREIDGMALAGAPRAQILVQEYKERLQMIKERMQKRKIEESKKEDTSKISMIGEVKQVRLRTTWLDLH